MKINNISRIILAIFAVIIVAWGLNCVGKKVSEEKDDIVPVVGDITDVSEKYTEVVSLAGNPYTYSIPVEDLPVPAAKKLKAILPSSPGIEKVISKH